MGNYEILVEHAQDRSAGFWVKDLVGAEKARQVEAELMKRFPSFDGWHVSAYKVTTELEPVCL